MSLSRWMIEAKLAGQETVINEAFILESAAKGLAILGRTKASASKLVESAAFWAAVNPSYFRDNENIAESFDDD